MLYDSFIQEIEEYDKHYFDHFNNSTTESISLRNEKVPSSTSQRRLMKWTHIYGNMHRIPTIHQKYSLLSKVDLNENNHKKGINTLSLSPRGRLVAFGLTTGEVQIRRLSVLTQDDAMRIIRKPCEKPIVPITCLRFVPSMENVCFCSDLSGSIEIFETEKMCKQPFNKENNEINTFDINYSGTHIVSGGKDGVLRIYDGFTGKVLGKSTSYISLSFNVDPSKFHCLRLYCVKFDPTNYNIFLSGGLDGYIKMWDMRQCFNAVRTIRGPYLRGDAIDFWGNVLLTGSWKSSKSIDLWDPNSGKHIETLMPLNRTDTLDSDFYECVRFFNGCKNGPVVAAGGSGSGKMEIFNLEDRRIEFAVDVKNSIRTIESTLSSIVCGSLDGICRVIKYNRSDD